MSGTKFSKRQLVGFDFTKWNEYTEQSLASAPEAFVSLLNCAVQEAYTDMCVLRGVRNPVVPRFEHRAGTLSCMTATFRTKDWLLKTRLRKGSAPKS
jgi:hypothetical protein